MLKVFLCKQTNLKVSLDMKKIIGVVCPMGNVKVCMYFEEYSLK